jgi:hypothetical protein
MPGPKFVSSSPKKLNKIKKYVAWANLTSSEIIVCKKLCLPVFCKLVVDDTPCNLKAD